MLIGNEVLPNVYINNINIFDKKIEMVVSVADDTLSPVWSNKGILKQELELRVVAISDENLVAGVTNGRIHLSHIKSDREVLLVSRMNTVELIEDGGLFDGHTVFYKKLTFDIREEITNLTLFANLFVSSLNIEGPIASENVIRHSQPIVQSMIFYKEDYQYYGPVHKHGGVFMEGAFHSSNPHRTLTANPIPNYKLKE